MAIELLPVQDASPDQEDVFGHQLFKLTNENTTKAMLQRRGFHGVLRRHGGSEAESVTQLARARQEVEAGNLDAVYIIETSGPRMVLCGMASAVKDLTARRSILPLPGALVRRLPSKPVNTVQGPNIAAWARPGKDQYEKLQPAYHALARSHPGTAENPAWTFEVSGDDNVHSAILDSGFIPKPNNGYGGWDDGELKYAPVRYGQLYIAGSDILPAES